MAFHHFGLKQLPGLCNLERIWWKTAAKSLWNWQLKTTSYKPSFLLLHPLLEATPLVLGLAGCFPIVTLGWEVPCPSCRARERYFWRKSCNKVALQCSEQAAESLGRKPRSHLITLSCFCTPTAFSGHICLLPEDASAHRQTGTNSHSTKRATGNTTNDSFAFSFPGTREGGLGLLCWKLCCKQGFHVTVSCHRGKYFTFYQMSWEQIKNKDVTTFLQRSAEVSCKEASRAWVIVIPLPYCQLVNGWRGDTETSLHQLGFLSCEHRGWLEAAWDCGTFHRFNTSPASKALVTWIKLWLERCAPGGPDVVEQVPKSHFSPPPSLIRPCLTWGKHQSLIFSKLNSLKTLYKRADTYRVSWRRKGDSQTSVQKEGLIYTPTRNSPSLSFTVVPPFPCLLARKDLLGLVCGNGHWATTHLQDWAAECCFWSRVLPTLPSGHEFRSPSSTQILFYTTSGSLVTFETSSASSNVVEDQWAV